ncbi:MAG: hypothetical protein AAF138_05685 [Planctomycetota bacterium]
MELAASQQSPEENLGDGAVAWAAFFDVLSEASMHQNEVIGEWEAENPDWERDAVFGRFEVNHSAIAEFDRVLAQRRLDIDDLDFDDPDAAARRWAEEGRDLALAVLERLDAEGVVFRLDAALGRPTYVRPDHGELLMQLPLPELSVARTLAWQMNGRAGRAIVAGDDAAYVREFDRMLGVADVIDRTPTVITNLVADAIRNITFERVRHDLIVGRLDAEVSRAIVERLKYWTPKRSPMSVTLEGERVMAYSFLQTTHTDSGGGNGRPLVHTMDTFGLAMGTPMSPPPNWENVTGIALPTKLQSKAKLDGVFDRWQDAAALPFAERKALMPALETMREDFGFRYEFVDMATPTMGKWLDVHDEIEARERGLLIMLAVEVYRAEHGAPPETLDALTPGVLAEAPRDPFAPDGAFVYRVQEDEPLGYLLYSVGQDGADDGALAPEGVNWFEAFDSDRVRMDAVFSRLRPIPELDAEFGFDDE